MKCPTIAIVGAGRLGTALAERLNEAEYIAQILPRNSRSKIPSLDLVWFCVPDAQIKHAAKRFLKLQRNAKFAFHSSGVLSSHALSSLRNTGTCVASVHPLMTFVKGSVPELVGVPFAIEGDPSAVRVARSIVRDLGGQAVAIKNQDKVAYHAFATMICPLLVSLLATSEKTAALAGILAADARRCMLPIIRQTLRNYEKLGPDRSFSGPIMRGDLETIRAHLMTLAKVPVAKNVYVALARTALDLLPNRNRRQIARLLG